MKSCTILNDGPPQAGDAQHDIAAQLRSRINRLKGEFYDLEKGRVDYDAMRDSSAFQEYEQAAAMLTAFEPQQLKTRNERLAFWINLYNVLVIHGVMALKIRESVKEYPRFFRAICYRIGEWTFAPDDIEHGILRGNRRPFHGLFKPFSLSDPRFSLVIDPPDPRIHFALVCASASCPLINFYVSEQIEAQLELAASAFINSPEVEVRPEEGRLLLSPIFKWYGSDFGGRKGVIDLLVRYLNPGEGREFLLEKMEMIKVEWKDYDWQLNR